MLAGRYLQLDFGFTAYATTAYFKAGPLAPQLLAGPLLQTAQQGLQIYHLQPPKLLSHILSNRLEESPLRADSRISHDVSESHCKNHNVETKESKL